jgi:hypothetical protein
LATVATASANGKPTAFKYQWQDAIRQPCGLRPTTRHVLLVLSFYMREDGLGAYPSIETLRFRTGVSRRTVIRALRDAQKGGFLRWRKGQPGRSNQYEATLPRWCHGGTQHTKPSAPKGARAEGGALSSLPEDACARCEQKLPLHPPDFLHCRSCLAVAS